jgi:hypothetical protein
MKLPVKVGIECPASPWQARRTRAIAVHCTTLTASDATPSDQGTFFDHNELGSCSKEVTHAPDFAVAYWHTDSADHPPVVVWGV